MRICENCGGAVHVGGGKWLGPPEAWEQKVLVHLTPEACQAAITLSEMKQALGRTHSSPQKGRNGSWERHRRT